MLHNAANPSTTERRQRGLTLIELLVGVAVVAIITTVGVPQFRGFIANQNRVAGTNDVVMSMMLARSEALKLVRHVTICASKDGNTCATNVSDWRHGWIVFANTARSNAGKLDSGETLIRMFPALGGGAVIASPDGLGAVVTFRPTGDVDTGGTLTYCDDRGAPNARAIVLERSGRARVTTRTFDGSEVSCG